MHIVLGLLVAFAVLVFVRWRSGARRACRWRANRTQDHDGRAYWRCAACGAETFVQGARPPRDCLRRG